MKVCSLFSGIGGFDLAFKRLGHVTVYANEWDKYAAQIYNQRFHAGEESEGGNPLDAGSGVAYQGQERKTVSVRCDTRDLRTVPASEIPDHDCLVGGFPCQAFSVAGKRLGFEDTRGTLFFDIARILREKKPRLCVLENVKGLLSHDNGRTFKVIIASLDELGYDLQWQVLNSKDFGVPQNRERVFIVGHLRGTSRPEVFPIGGNDETRHGQGEPQTANTLTANYWKGPAASRPIVQVNQPTHSNDRVYGTDGIGPTLNTMQGGRRQPKIVEGPRIRRLTPTECERLQGFPDGWTKYGLDQHGNTTPISDTQRYKTLGNAVSVPVVEEIAKRLG